MEITKGKLNKAIKCCIYGPEGIGKSSLAAQFPDPVYIDTEGSTHAMDVARLPAPSSWNHLMQEVEYVRDNPTCCKTLVIDTIDWAEALCVGSICARHNKNGIEDFGYGNGYVYAREEFGRLLNKLSEVIDRGVNVVLTAHAQIRKFELPDEMGAYDRWELKLGKKTSSQTSPLVKEWSDMLLFCNYKTTVVNVDGQGATKGKNKAQGGKRVMYTTHHNCWDAKNRYGLPEECDMSYEAIRHILESTAVTPSPEPAQSPPIEIAKAKEERQETKEAQKESEPKVDHRPEAPMVMETYVAPPELRQEKTQPEPEVTFEPPRLFSDPSKIPKALIDLMEGDNVCEWHIQEACAAKGYFPPGMLIQDMGDEFIRDVLIAAWPQVKAMVDEIIVNQAVVFN